MAEKTGIPFVPLAAGCAPTSPTIKPSTPILDTPRIRDSLGTYVNVASKDVVPKITLSRSPPQRNDKARTSMPGSFPMDRSANDSTQIALSNTQEVIDQQNAIAEDARIRSALNDVTDTVQALSTGALTAFHTPPLSQHDISQDANGFTTTSTGNQTFY